MTRILLALAALMLVTGTVQGQEEQEQKASSNEISKINNTLAKVGCKAVEVEKETPQLFEVDDAECTVGQYDIKLDGVFNIISMTKDF